MRETEMKVLLSQKKTQ